MLYKILNGKDIKTEIALIKKTLDKAPDTVFIYNGSGRLYHYIDLLTESEDENNSLGDEYACKLKICYEKNDLKLLLTKENENSTRLDSITTLVGLLDKEVKTKIIFENNSRSDLAFVVQQLIYIQYSLNNISILLQQELDNYKIKEKAGDYLSWCNSALLKLDEANSIFSKEKDLETKIKGLKNVTSAFESCANIKKSIERLRKNELKLAIAASRKTGKSIMVNCFIGEEIAIIHLGLATPDNCVYRPSNDGKYHLKHEGKNDDRVFDSVEDLYKAIYKEVREAENEDFFKSIDLNIGYVANDNNPYSYTIYDTPGPDAAGTGRKEDAKNALEKCDVAIFAIDYAKYLTDSEEKYLKEVKKTFKEQGKFHTLIFALNKIDIRYFDTKDTKSLVKAVDFIKNRLSEIDKEYSDCIIFPTCSLEYFYAIDAEKSGADELKEEISIDEIVKIKKSHKNIVSLQWLYKHSANLEDYHGFKTVSYDIFKEDSGMPALMKYVDSVAQGKCNDEASKLSDNISLLQNSFYEIANLMVKYKDSKANAIVDEIRKASEELKSLSV